MRHAHTEKSECMYMFSACVYLPDLSTQPHYNNARWQYGACVTSIGIVVCRKPQDRDDSLHYKAVKMM